LVPANGFAEYAPEPNPETKKKDVVWFALNDDRPLFAFAGIWTTFSGDRGTKSKPVPGPHQVYGFLTTSPNAVVEPRAKVQRLLNSWRKAPSRAYEGIRVEPELLAETWLKSKTPASEAGAPGAGGGMALVGHQLHELGSIDVIALTRRSASRVTLPAHQAVCR
jgi:hypothetical protein